MPTPTAAAMPRYGLCPVDMNAIAEITEATPVCEPTEMSSAPQMMTTVCTTASSPATVAASPITWMLDQVR